MTRPLRVCLLGFTPQETDHIGSGLRALPARHPSFQPVSSLEEAELVVVDADQTDSLAALVRLGRLEHAVFIGSETPHGADGWLARPWAPARLLAELDRLAFSMGLSDPRPAEAPSSSAGLLSRPGPLRPATSPPPAPPPSGWALALLVDADDVAAGSLEQRLHDEGLHTERAAHSGQALVMMADKAYDFVFTAVDLGTDSDLDGLVLCQQIKRQRPVRDRGPASVVVIMAASHSEVERVRAALAGADAYLPEAVDADSLRKVLWRNRR
jgi:CheY-like chemotaxis protein